MGIKTILIIDDNEAEQFLYRHLVNTYDPNIKVESVYDGEEALAYLEDTSKEQPDCILLDINMPRMNGFEFLEAYTQKFADHPIVITMLTSSTMAIDKDRALEYDCVKAFFLKPITVESLETLSKLVEEQS